MFPIPAGRRSSVPDSRGWLPLLPRSYWENRNNSRRSSEIKGYEQGYLLSFDHRQRLTNDDRFIFVDQSSYDHAIHGRGQIDRSRPCENLDHTFTGRHPGSAPNEPDAESDRLVVETKFGQAKFDARQSTDPNGEKLRKERSQPGLSRDSSIARTARWPLA
jgi:hypothetical protein